MSEFVLRRTLLYTIAQHYGIEVVEIRERVQRINSRLSVYVNAEDNEPHHRPHAHITVNNHRIGRIFIDTFELDGSLERQDTSAINQWLKNNKQLLIDAWSRNNNRIDIDFFQYNK